MAKITMQEEGSTPPAPGSGKWGHYFKSDGWYYLEDTGTEIGPIGKQATWTPTWAGLTLGNGVLTRGYARNNKVVIGHLELVFGTTTAITGDVTFSPPITQGTYGAISAPVGLARVIAGGVGAIGTVIALTTTSFRIAVNTSSGAYVGNALLSSTVPGTWTTGDIIQVQFQYFVN